MPPPSACIPFLINFTITFLQSLCLAWIFLLPDAKNRCYFSSNTLAGFNRSFVAPGPNYLRSCWLLTVCLLEFQGQANFCPMLIRLIHKTTQTVTLIPIVLSDKSFSHRFESEFSLGVHSHWVPEGGSAWAGFRYRFLFLSAEFWRVRLGSMDPGAAIPSLAGQASGNSPQSTQIN
jgi:hypothetical protein